MATEIGKKLENSCAEGKEQCLNCHKHFMEIRPQLTGVVVTKHFFRDFKDDAKANAAVTDILDCSNLDFYEMHKFEKNVDGALIFRAKKEGVHMVYAVDPQLRLVFLRAFKNYSEYGKFLEDKKEIKNMIAHI